MFRMKSSRLRGLIQRRRRRRRKSRSDFDRLTKASNRRKRESVTVRSDFAWRFMWQPSRVHLTDAGDNFFFFFYKFSSAYQVIGRMGFLGDEGRWVKADSAHLIRLLHTCLMETLLRPTGGPDREAKGELGGQPKGRMDQ